MEQWKKVAWPGLINHVFFYIRWMVGCLWGIPGTRIFYGKKASQQRQCDGLGNGLLENLVMPSMWMYFDTYHLPKHCSTPFNGIDNP